MTEQGEYLAADVIAQLRALNPRAPVFLRVERYEQLLLAFSENERLRAQVSLLEAQVRMLMAHGHKGLARSREWVER